MIDDHRLTESKQPKDLLSQLNKAKTQCRENVIYSHLPLERNRP